MFAVPQLRDSLTEGLARTQRREGAVGGSPPALADSSVLEKDPVTKCPQTHAHPHTSTLKKPFVNVGNNSGDLWLRNGILDEVEREVSGLVAQAQYKEESPESVEISRCGLGHRVRASPGADAAC